MYKAIITDDSPESLDYCGKLLGESPDFEVIGTAENGQQLIDLLRSLTPDVVLLDTFLPDNDGIELTEYIKEEYPSVQVILITAVWDAAMERLALESGALAYISKIRLKAEQLLQLLAGQ
ncbi:unnamed protein product [marine sediment metagenome]|uniref:Response regulatory domain-containing protein n=1 Tax=marine sediment metagenome TaxID=412755 RepID=X1V339_9ZZZZ